LQDILDRKSPVTPAVPSQSEYEESDDSDEDEYQHPTQTNTNFQKAVDEFNVFESYKMKRYRPVLDLAKSKVLSGEDKYGKVYEIVVGPVETRGKDLPSGKNLADYIDKRGRIDLLCLFIDHKQIFPTLFIKCKCEAARKIVEVGCERFFSISGYVSAPRRTRLGVRTYERLALLASIIQHVYIDQEWVAKEYLRRCKEGLWKEENTKDALKCWNLERILDAELLGKQVPMDMTMEDLLAEAVSSLRDDGSNGDDGVDLLDI